MVEINGYGSGSGYGDGSGDGSSHIRGYGGDGSGDGYGHGLGDRYGDGYGSGYGYGSGNGSGGYGYDSGSGYGDGDVASDGSGDGFGYGSGSIPACYWLACINVFSKTWPIEQREALQMARVHGATIAYWRSNQFGLPANGGIPIQCAAPGVIHRSSGPLSLCSSGTLHATLIPPRWVGERMWVVALRGEVIGDDEKLGCLEREILGECI